MCHITTIENASQEDKKNHKRLGICFKIHHRSNQQSLK